MLRRSMLFITICAVGAAVLPAMASASWKHHNTAIQQNVQLGLTGNFRIQGALGGLECQITSRVRLEPGTSGTIETLVPHPTSDTINCKGLGGLKECQIHDLTFFGLSWAIATNSVVVTVSTKEFTATFTNQVVPAFCPIKHLFIYSGTVTITFNQPNTVSSATLSGQLQADLQTNAGSVDKENVTVSGTLSVESPNANTYSI